MVKVYNILEKIKKQGHTVGDGYPVAPLPEIKNHRLGFSESMFPMYFIKCKDDLKTNNVDLNLEFISVHYNRNCLLVSSDLTRQEGVYTIISLKTDRHDLQEYFTEVVYLIVKRLPELPSLIDLRVEMEKLITLFSKFSKPAFKSIQGLWAELLIIEQSCCPDYLIKAWHSSPNDKFDFNDGEDKIEIKSTSTITRKHRFSADQLSPNLNSKLIIASVILIETGMGKNISHLVKSIEMRLKDNDLAFILNETIATTLGKDFEKSFDVFYDYQYAIDSINYYNWQDIPSIPRSSIPEEWSNIKFDCDLSNIPTLEYSDMESKLYNALFKNIGK